MSHRKSYIYIKTNDIDFAHFKVLDYYSINDVQKGHKLDSIPLQIPANIRKTTKDNKKPKKTIEQFLLKRISMSQLCEELQTQKKYG